MVSVVFRWLVMLVALLCGLAAEQPNVVVILAEDWRPEARQVATPNVDRLRAEGVEFSNFLTSSTATATQAALLSGVHEFRCGVSAPGRGRNWIRPEVPLMPEMFRKVGYHTAIVGKWGLGDGLPSRPEDRGFETICVHGGGGIGSASDRWGNGPTKPWMRTNGGWKPMEREVGLAWFDEAGRFLQARAADKRPFFLHLATCQVPGAGEAAVDLGVGRVMEELSRLELDRRTMVVFLGVDGSEGLQGRCLMRWPERLPAGRVVGGLTAPVDVLPTLTKLFGIPLPVAWHGDGLDLSAAMIGEAAVAADRLVFSHPGGWPGDDSPERHRGAGFSVRDGRWLLEGLELYDLAADPGRKRNVFEAFPVEGSRLLTAYGNWWNSVLPTVREPVRPLIGDARQAVVSLTAADWWPSRESDGALSTGLAKQSEIRNRLDALLAGGRDFAETSGHWKLRAARDGHYQVTLSMVPAEAAATERDRLGQLKAGTVHVRAGRREVQMPLLKTATSVTLGMDLNAGDVDLEGWFTGQLSGNRLLGAFFATIERVGERRMPDVELEIRKEPKKTPQPPND